MREDLGARLLRAGLVTGAGLARCLSTGGRSLEHGGRLAEALAEGELLEDALAGFFLGEGYAPLLGEDALGAADLELLQRLPLEVALEHRCLPIGSGDHGVVVAMADPSSGETVGLLEGHLGQRVLPAVARWSHLRAALESVRAELLPARAPALPEADEERAIIELVRRRTPTTPVERPVAPSDATQPEVIMDVSPSMEPAARQTAEFGFLPLPLERSKPTVEQPRRGIDDWSDLSEGPEPPPSAPPSPSRSGRRTSPRAAPREGGSRLPDIGAKLAEMRATDDRDLLFRRASEAMATACRTVVFFVLRDGVLKGWDGEGPELSRDSIRSLWIPTGTPSVFHDVVVEGDFYHGPHGERAADRLFRATVNSPGRALLVLPVQVNGKVVALFACDDVLFGGEGVERARTLAHGTGAALKRIILSRRG